MTLVDVKNALFSHFLTESTFVFKDDLGGLGLDDTTLGEALAPHKEALVQAALDDFVRASIILAISPGVYVLTQPLNTFNQQVLLSPIGAEMVADLVTQWHSFHDGPPYTANKLAISSHDIESLCHYCHFLLDEDITPLRGD